MPNLVQVIKKAAIDAVEASKPSRFVYGEITSVDPLIVRVEQKMLLSKEFLVLPERLTDHEIELSTAGSDLIKYVWHNALKLGDKVVLLQQKGGQRFLVLDRLVMK